MESASVALGHAEHDEHHGPPEANQSSRVEAQFLGMLLFIISEIMLFGAFFTAYFFIRVVGDDPWPAEGEELPVAIAGVNTAILISSSFTMHWALEGARNENRARCGPACSPPLLLGLTFLTHPDQRVRAHRLLARRQRPGHRSSTASPGLHGAHVFVGLTLLTFATIRAFRGHFTAKEHRGVEVPGIYWHFVDVMWIVVYTTIYIL